MGEEKKKRVMCPTCEKITEHRTSIEEAVSSMWVVDSCIVCGSQWRVPKAKPAGDIFGVFFDE